MQGTVKWFNRTRGYGFIVPAEGDADIFVHFSEIQTEGKKTLNEGDRVEFTTTDGEQGPRATEVKVLAPAPDQPEPDIPDAEDQPEPDTPAD